MWRECIFGKNGMFYLKQQWLLNQKWQIVTKKSFPDLEEKMMKDDGCGWRVWQVACEGSVGFGEEVNVLCKNECDVGLEDTCLNQD